MKEAAIISECYRHQFGNEETGMSQLPGSGSDRKYFRISTSQKSIIAAYNPVKEENEAFISFTRHFISKGLHVPQLFGYLPDKYVYFLEDLGDTTLFTWLRRKGLAGAFDAETENFYRKVLDHLILFQTRGIEGLDLSLCYPHRSFDRQSMMWDMNYFKYMFLKLLAVPFNERDLEHDFITLSDYLLEAGQDFFLYRDFQTANIMVVGDDPWFIDYQGGRKGASQYDVASLLYDAKIPMPEKLRDELLAYYSAEFCSVTKSDRKEFMNYYTGFSLIRIMQALGAFGFRGLYEKKPTFTESVVPGVRHLLKVISLAESVISLPELYGAARAISGTEIYRELSLRIN